MRVVADSHTILWYLTGSQRISDTAVAALIDAEGSDGICVPAASLLDLWYATHKQGPSKLRTSAYEFVKSTVQDEGGNYDVLPFAASSIEHAEGFPKSGLSDPFDRMIVAAALEHGLPLVTADKRMTELAVVPIIW